MAGTSDLLAQSLLLQSRRPQQSVQSRLAAQMMQQVGQQQGPVWGTAGVLSRAIPGAVAGFLAARGETADREAEQAQFQRLQEFESQRRASDQSELQRLMGGSIPGMGGGQAPQPMPAAMPQGMPQEPMQSAPMAPMQSAPLPPMQGAAPRGEAPQAVTQGIAARAALDPNAPDYPERIMAINNSVVGQTMPGQAPRPVPQQAPPAMPQQAMPQGMPQAPQPSAQGGGQISPAVIAQIQAAAAGGNQMAARMLPGLQWQYEQQVAAQRRDQPNMTTASPGSAIIDPRTGRIIGTVPQDRAPVNVAPGNALVDPNTGRPIYQAPPGQPSDETGRLLAAAGLQPGTPEYQAAARQVLDRRGTPPTTTVSLDTGARTGPIPAGYELVRGPDGSNEMRPIRNSAADREAGGAVATAQRSLQQIDAVLEHPALRTATGMTAFTGAIPGSPMMDFRTRVDQLQGQAFLQAFESLKGGGQITEMEGRKATDAIARLNRSVSASDFRAALQELRDVVSAARDRAQPPRSGGAPIGTSGLTADPPAPAAAPAARLRFNPTTGNIE